MVSYTSNYIGCVICAFPPEHKNVGDITCYNDQKLRIKTQLWSRIWDVP